jgi:hypothetical protein
MGNAIGRQLKIVALVTSCLACLAAVGFWGRSYWRADEFQWTSPFDPNFVAAQKVISCNLLAWDGRICFSCDRITFNPEIRILLVFSERGFNQFHMNWQQMSVEGVHPWHGFEFERWKSRYDPGKTLGFSVTFPFWALTAAMAIASLVQGRRALRRWYRVQRGRCSQCGYDLTGNTSGACPECGSAIQRVRLAERLPGKVGSAAIYDGRTN